MGASSDVEYPLAPGGGARDGRERYDAGQNSFEQLSRHHQGDSELDLPWDNRPGGLGGRSISGEERVAATALLDCVKQRPLSRASDAPSADGGGGGRVDSGVWPMIHLLGTGGEADFHQVQVCGRKEAPGGADGVDLPLRNASAGSSGGNSARTTEEERRIEEELLGSMPKQAPFGGFRSASGSGSRSSTRSASKKAIFLASRDGLSSEKMWRKGDSSSLSRLFASSFRRSSSSTSSSGSGGSGGGGPGAGVGGTTPHCGGGGGSIKYSGGGGGASWEHNLGPLATTGGASRTHDDIVNRNGAAAPAHPLRQQSFGPDGEIGDLSLLRDDRIPPYNAPQTGSPGYRHTPATGVTAAGLVFGDNGGSFGETPAGVRNWENAAAAARFTASRPASEPSSIVYNRGGISTFGGNAPVPPGPRMFPGGQTTPSNHHNSHHSSHLNTATAGPIAPPPTPRVAVLQAAAPVPPAPAHHEKKSSFNLLASMIPDISKLGGPSSAPALQTSTTWPGATAGLAAHGGSPMVTIDGNPIQAGGLWTRQAALARYHYKRKRRPFVKAMRENDPNRKEQNKARERPRNFGKFKKKHQDFVSIIDMQRAAASRSISGEVTSPARDSTTPPSSSQKRRCVGDGGGGGGGGGGGDGGGDGGSDDGDGSGGRSLRSRRSQATGSSGGIGEISTRCRPTPDEGAKLGPKRGRVV